MTVKYVDIQIGENGRMPYKKYRGDAGWDLFVSEGCTIPPHTTSDVHTDIKINMPTALYGRIVGRSSSLRNHGLYVNEGIIDNGYSGELFICVHNMTDKPFIVEKGMRLAQIIFHVIEDVRWSEVDKLPDPMAGQRGDNGFGSTGE